MVLAAALALAASVAAVRAAEPSPAADRVREYLALVREAPREEATVIQDFRPPFPEMKVLHAMNDAEVHALAEELVRLLEDGNAIAWPPGRAMADAPGPWEVRHRAVEVLRALSGQDLPNFPFEQPGLGPPPPANKKELDEKATRRTLASWRAWWAVDARAPRSAWLSRQAAAIRGLLKDPGAADPWAVRQAARRAVFSGNMEAAAVLAAGLGSDAAAGHLDRVARMGLVEALVHLDYRPAGADLLAALKTAAAKPERVPPAATLFVAALCFLGERGMVPAIVAVVRPVSEYQLAHPVRDYSEPARERSTFLRAAAETLDALTGLRSEPFSPTSPPLSPRKMVLAEVAIKAGALEDWLGAAGKAPPKPEVGPPSAGPALEFTQGANRLVARAESKGGGGTITVQDAAGGKRLWEVRLPAPAARMAYLDGRIVVHAGGETWEIDAASGKVLARYPGNSVDGPRPK
jgi:hypothetical protein